MRTKEERAEMDAAKAVMPEGHEWCNHGKHSRPIDQFSLNSANSQGFSYTCKDCQRVERLMWKNKYMLKPVPVEPKTRPKHWVDTTELPGVDAEIRDIYSRLEAI